MTRDPTLKASRDPTLTASRGMTQILILLQLSRSMTRDNHLHRQILILLQLSRVVTRDSPLHQCSMLCSIGQLQQEEVGQPRKGAAKKTSLVTSLVMLCLDAENVDCRD